MTIVHPTNAPAPVGAEAGDWTTDPTPYRVLYGAARSIPSRPDVTILPTAVQLADGSIDPGEIEPPAVHVEVGANPLTVDQARRLAAEVMAAADYLAGLAPDPAHPLDAYSLPAIVEHVARRISGPGALRHALAATNAADLTPADRDLMLDLIQQSEQLEFEAMMARRAARGID
jgi:hypothetical protein